MARLVGVVLAAGESRRTGFPKAVATLDGEPLVARAGRLLLEGGCDAVLVVVGPPHGKVVARAARGMDVVENPDPSRGMRSSLEVAFASEPLGDADAAAVSLVDHPRVAPATVRSVVAAWEAAGSLVARPRYRGRRGHPMLVARRAFSLLGEAPPEQTTRDWIRALWPSTEVDVDDPHILDDLDGPGALEDAGVVAPRR